METGGRSSDTRAKISAEQHGKNPSNKRLKEEKLDVQILNPVNTESSCEFVDTLKSHTPLTNELEIKLCNDVDYFDPEKPLIVVCPSSSRLQPDVDLAISRIKRSIQYVVIVLHIGSEHNLPALPSRQKLSGYDNITFVDMGMSYQWEIYKCQQNNEAETKMISHVRDFYEKKEGLSSPKPVNQHRPNQPSTPLKLLSDTPWRIPQMSEDALHRSLFQEIKALNPKRKPLILLFGPEGAGKSSFINSCLSVVEGRKTNLAKSGSGISSYTFEFKDYSLLDNFRLMDCMGILSAHGEGFSADDIRYLLQGHIKKNYKFDPLKSITQDSPFYREKPEFEHKTQCVVFVVDSRTVHPEIPKEYVEKIKILQDTGVPRVLLLTQVDELCGKSKEDPSNIFKSPIVEKTVNLASEIFSIEIASIHPLINYEDMLELSTAISVPVLLALRQILQNACDRVEKVMDNLQDCADETETLLRKDPSSNPNGSGNEFPENADLGCPEIMPMVLLVGHNDTGKSFIRYCCTVGAERKKVNAKTGSASLSHTLECKIYKTRVFQKNFRLMDCNQPSHKQGILSNDISSILQGHVKKGYKFDPETTITEDSKYYRKQPEINHKIHCVVFVIDSRSMHNYNPNEFDKIKPIHDKIKEADIPRVLILTHVDKLCEAVDEDASNVVNPIVEEARKKAKDVFSIEMEFIHPVVNYEEKSALTKAINQILHRSYERVKQLMDLSESDDDFDDDVDDDHDVGDDHDVDDESS